MMNTAYTCSYEMLFTALPDSSISVYEAMKPAVQKLLWRSRRGMLELDALFRHYLTGYGDELSAAELGLFERLLECQDQDLFDVFAGNKSLDDQALDQLFKRIISQLGDK